MPRPRTSGSASGVPPRYHRPELVRAESAVEDFDVRRALLSEVLHQARQHHIVSPGEYSEADRFDVLLDGRGGNHLWRLVEARIDHLVAGVAQRARDHLGPPVVAVEAGLGDQDPDFGRAHGVIIPQRTRAEQAASSSRRIPAPRSRKLSARRLRAAYSLRPRALPGPGHVLSWSRLASRGRSDGRGWLLSAGAGDRLLDSGAGRAYRRALHPPHPGRGARGRLCIGAR